MSKRKLVSTDEKFLEGIRRPATKRMLTLMAQHGDMRMSSVARNAIRTCIENDINQMMQATLKMATTQGRHTITLRDLAQTTSEQIATEKEEEEEEKETNYGEEYLGAMQQVVPKFYAPVLKELLPFPQELVESVSSWFGVDDDPRVVTPFHVVRVYYKHGEVSTDHYSSVSLLMRAAAEHENEITENDKYGDLCFYAPTNLTNSTVSTLLKGYLDQLKHKSRQVMTGRQIGYRWHAIFSGPMIA